MADFDFIQPNRLRQEANQVRTRLLAVALPMLGLMAFVHIVLAWLGLIVLILLWRRGEKHMHGADGEDMALGVPKAYAGSLIGLSDDYTIFNQVIVPNGESFREIDFVVVGPGIFAIEVKHHRGEIRGSEPDKAWRQKKRSQAGNLYEQDMRNPVAQVKGGVFALKNYLATHGVNNWIQGIVVFTHPECSLSIGESTVPVLRLEQLTPYIERFRPLWPLQKQGTVVRALKLLRQSPAPHRTAWQKLLGIRSYPRLLPALPQPIKYFMRDFVAPEQRVNGATSCYPGAARKNVHQATTPPPYAPAPAMAPNPAPSRPRPRHRPFTVIQGGQRGTARTRKVETTVFLKRVETETTGEDDERGSF